MAKPRSTGTRVTGGGGSVLGFGASASTSPKTTDRDIVQALAIFLEDRRVLFNPEHLEVESQVDHSVQEIRRELTEALQQLDPKGPAIESIRAMRAACRRYLDEPRQTFRHMGDYGHRRHNAEPGFFVALGELRAVFSAELKRLDDRFKLEIESHIRGLFPKSE